MIDNSFTNIIGNKRFANSPNYNTNLQLQLEQKTKPLVDNFVMIFFKQLIVLLLELLLRHFFVRLFLLCNSSGLYEHLP